MKRNYTLGQTPIPGYKYSSGIGYIAIPTDIDRDKFISLCFKNLKVSIWTEDGGFSNQVPISYDDLNIVIFPDDPKQLGSPIVWVLEHTHNQPMIVKVFNQSADMGDSTEGQMRFKKTYKSALTELTGSAKKGFLGLNITTDKDAQFFINVRSKNHNASFDTEVDGNINTFASGNIKYQQNGGFILKTLKVDDNTQFASMEQDTSSHNFTNKKFSINNGEQPFVLGNALKDFLSNFISQVAASTVGPTGGPLLNAEAIQAFIDQLDQLLSQVGYIDK